MLRPSVGGVLKGRKAWGLVTLIAGTSAGGAFLGLVVGSAGALFQVITPVLRVGVAVGMVTIALVALVAPGVTLPGRSRQVQPEDMQRYLPWVAALKWGAQLGTGFATHVATPALYALVGSTVALPAGDAVLACTLYGLTRGSAIAIAGLMHRPVKDGGQTAFSVPRWPTGLLRRARWPSVFLASWSVTAIIKTLPR